jgi:elongation of very long chain fatty acids protein 6
MSNGVVTGLPVIDQAIAAYQQQFTTVYGPFWVSQKYPYVIPAVTVILYVLMVKKLPGLMKRFKATEKGIDVGAFMPLWNLFLSVWSFFMAVGIGIPYLKFLYKDGFFTGVCDERRGLYEPNTMGIWAHMFVVSKYAELVDTLLLILKHPDREVPFLHWYHHTTVLLFTWYADLYQYTGAIFMIVNATVHTFMYYYYFRKETGHNPSWALPLTIGQISQMFLGIFVNGSWIYMRWVEQKPCPCDAPLTITIACALMYGSYAYLFLKFFYFRYIKKRTPKPVSKPVKKE